MYHSNKLLLVKTNLSVSSFFTLHNVFSAKIVFFDMQNSENSEHLASYWLDQSNMLCLLEGEEGCFIFTVVSDTVKVSQRLSGATV